jgi:hypothetical protein
MKSNANISIHSTQFLAILAQLKDSIQVIPILMTILRYEEETFPPEAPLGALGVLGQNFDFRIVSRMRHY